MADGLREAHARYKETAIRWGFIWALWCAVLWGAWYVPGFALFFEEPFASFQNTTNEGLQTAAAITAANAAAVLLAMFLWVAVLGKTREYGRTIRRFGKISKWYFAGAIFGGPMAIYGSYLAIYQIGAQFGAVAALLYPIVGAALARAWYKEKITQRAALGILVIVLGGVVIFTPGLAAEITGTGDGAWLGYLGGLMAVVGWGIEGAIAGRALDVTDPDVGLTIRFTAETLYWFVLILPLSAIWLGDNIWSLIGNGLQSGAVLLWLGLAGLTFGFCYVSWYKSFPLIGVGRGQAIADLYAMFALGWLTLFTLDLPEWQFFVGALICILGGFIMYTERRDVLEVIRTVPGIGRVQGEAEPVLAGGTGDITGVPRS
jgi:drug/metabolite transporter (DMT)-like permease